MDGIDDEDCAELKFGPGSSPFDHFHARALKCLRILYRVPGTESEDVTWLSNSEVAVILERKRNNDDGGEMGWPA